MENAKEMKRKNTNINTNKKNKKMNKKNIVNVKTWSN
jgi:hypothetical protein